MSEWKECKLGDVAGVYNGYSFKSGEYHSFHPGHLEVLKMGHIEPGGGLRKLPKKDYMPRESRFEKYILKKNDIVLAMTDMKDSMGILGHPAIIDLDDHYVLNQRVARIIVQDHKNIDFTFLFYQMRSTDFISELQSRAHSGVQVNLTTSAIKDARILLPQLPEQRAIAGVLSSLDDKIDLLHRQNKTLEGMAEALWRKMFVPACAGEPHADREEADPGWKKGKLGDIAEINPLRSIKKEAITTYLDMSNMPTDGPFPKEWVQRDYSSGMKFKNGDTVIARITPCLENGKTAYVNFLNNEEIAWGSTEYIILAPKTGYSSEWYYFLARNDDFRDFAIQNMTGTSGRQRVSGDSIAQYEIAIPPMNITERFRTFAGPVMDHIKHNSFQIRTLIRLRDTLIPKLMSGEVRVKL